MGLVASLRQLVRRSAVPMVIIDCSDPDGYVSLAHAPLLPSPGPGHRTGWDVSGMSAWQLDVGDAARILSPFIQRGIRHDYLTILA
jgi:hypothetical protein